MKKLSTTLLILLLIFSFNISYSQNNVSLSSFQSSVQGIVNNATANYGMDGAELSIILYDSIEAETFTSGNQAPGVSVQDTIPWHFASLTATYATYVILELIEEGSLTINDSLGMHMNTAAMGLDGSITVRELLRHTSPMKEFWNTSGPDNACFLDIWVNNPNSLGFPEDILNCRPADDPNKRGTYDSNNMNAIALGYLIDSVTGNSYKTEFQNRIFTPFGMDKTYMSGGDTVTCDSINGIYTTNSGYQCPNMSYIRYFSTNGTNRGLISRTKHVAKFLRSFYRDELLPANVMDSVKKVIPGSSLPVAPLACVNAISFNRGYNTDIFSISNSSGATSTLYGKSAIGMNASHSYHWMEKNWTFSFAQNDRSRQQEMGLLLYDLYCYLAGIDSVIYPPQVQSPIADFDTTVNGLIVNFTDLSQNNPDSWSWDFGDGNSSTAQNPTHTYIGNGSYTVTLIVSNSAGSDTSSKGLNVISSLNDFMSGKIKIYPNPSEGELIIDSELNEDYSLTVLDIYGRVIDFKDSELNASGAGRYHFPKEVESGQYILRIQSKSGIVVKKTQLMR